jgi:hypothetical protein
LASNDNQPGDYSPSSAEAPHHDDTNVMLLVSNTSFQAMTVHSEVGTAQVAPTILKALGLDPSSLDAVQAEGTDVLPAVQLQ